VFLIQNRAWQIPHLCFPQRISVLIDPSLAFKEGFFLFTWYNGFAFSSGKDWITIQRKDTPAMKKNDLILILLVLLAALAFYLGNQWINQKYDQKILTITSDGELVAQRVLTEDLTEEWLIDNHLGYNRIVVREGVVTMLEADCPDQVCVLSRPIREPGESIICLPHKVVVKIEGGASPEVDAIAD